MAISDHMSGTPEHKYREIDHAKLSIAPEEKLEDWSSTGRSSTPTINDGSVAVGARRFQDNVTRIPGSFFEGDIRGDNLPNVPAVLTGLLEEWPAFENPGVSWSVQDLAARTESANRVSLDGGPFFARNSMCSGKVSMKEYQRYCENDADGDLAPLYVFDPYHLESKFANGSLVQADFSIPPCFSTDAMSCCNGTRFRPLPPAWLLIGALSSGTPIHDHPLTVAWNALLTGCKLWCCLPPDVDESLLLLTLDEDSDEDFDLSAMQWFRQCGDLPTSARIIVQRPGEVVYLPVGWFHVVLNVETSTAISVSLTLHRDLPALMPLLMESDEEFATFWMKHLDQGLVFD
jgi:histone arginine demethylase JMJD6